MNEEGNGMKHDAIQRELRHASMVMSALPRWLGGGGSHEDFYHKYYPIIGKMKKSDVKLAIDRYRIKSARKKP